MLNPIEPPWYVTRMPGGVTGTARKGLPMSIFEGKSSIWSENHGNYPLDITFE